MLFGNEKIREKAINYATNLANTQNGKVIYGATMGSLAKGYQSYDSDYDVRFLYIKNDFPATIYCPAECEEKDIVQRLYEPTDGNGKIPMTQVFDRIALWELSAFLQLLVTPTFRSETYDSHGLYHTVEFTMYSPFTWDPYGIQYKVAPLIRKCFNKKSALSYYLNIINSRYQEHNGRSRLSEYARCVWVSLAINWILEQNSPAPIYIETILAGLKNGELKNTVMSFIQKFRQTRRNHYEDSDYKYRTMGNAILTEGDARLNNYIETAG